MKKNIIMLLLILFIPMFVYAGGNNDDNTDNSGVANKCENSSVGCAFCVYSFAQETGCHAKFSVTYKSDSTPLAYETYSSGSNSGYVSCSFSYANFAKNDFIDSNGNIKCPNANAKSEITSSSGRTAYTKITFSSSVSGTLAPTSESKIVNKSADQTPTPVQESYSCKYGDKFSVSVIDGTVTVTLNGYEGFIVSQNIDASIFTNKKCPDLYYYANTRGTKVFSIYDKNPGSYSRITGTLIDENTSTVPVPEPTPPSGDTGGSSGPSLNYSSLCAIDGLKSAAKIIGYIVLIAKWIVPLLLIVLGMVDFGKASISSDDKALNKATSTLIRRIVAGVIIFFIPTIVMALLNAIQVTKGIEKDSNTNFGACTKCIFDVTGSC